LQQEIEQERLFLTGRSDRIAECVEAIFLSGFVRRWSAGNGTAYA
jgi:hypothetical protein